MEEIVKVVQRALRQYLESKKRKLEVFLETFTVQESKGLSDEEFLLFTKYKNSGDHPFIAYLAVRYKTDAETAHRFYAEALKDAGLAVVDLPLSTRTGDFQGVSDSANKDGYFNGELGVIRRHNAIATIIFFCLKLVIAFSLYSTDNDQTGNLPLSLTATFLRYLVVDYIIKRALKKEDGEQYRDFINVLILNGIVWIIQLAAGLLIST